MKHFRNSLAVVASLVLNAAASAEEASHRLDLASAKAQALSVSPELSALRHAVDEASARKELGGTAYHPKVGVAAGAESRSNNATQERGSLGYLYGSLNLFNGFADSRRLDLAANELERASLSVRRHERLLELEVERRFSEYLFAKAALALNSAAVVKNDAQAEAAKRRRAAGLGSDADTLEFELRGASLKAKSLQLAQQEYDAEVELGRLLKLEDGRKINPVGTLEHGHIKGSLSEFLTAARLSNADIAEARFGVSAASISQNVWKSRWLPRVDFEARTGKLPMDERPAGETRVTTLALVATMDLYAGNESSWIRREGVARSMKEQRAFDAISQGVEAGVKRSFQRLKTLEASIDIEKANEGRAARYFDAVMREYRVGVKNSADLRVASEVSTDVSARLLQYTLDSIVERLEFERLVGQAIGLAPHQEPLQQGN